ncbi:DNA circularization N-terminal domain-containing protein [Nostoc sp. ChiQUE01b]|uniref:DNA circularization N-terminal domain-containing protein n=1 Tax=Nostoc sp. ChiQUE01b TaxID=3075376 RepID=UPI002AD31F17|nr:DNA circularization N-terminal domain-containing protein [Nostoc sp. ChiQUE01b]MDZ8263309.1 DNA circularization N-terminal domain-containing protein [Nostoc sp. ChiQUE01b]
MGVKLAGIDLQRVHRIQTLEQNHFVYHRIPGMQGNLVQNLGRDAVRLQIQGIFYGIKAQVSLEALRQVYKEHKPVDFMADVVGQAYFSQVTIEQFQVVQSSQEPDQFSYSLAITEYTPITSQTPTTDIDQNIKKDAAGFMTAALLPDALQMGAMPEITNPVEPLKPALEPIQETISGLNKSLAELKGLFSL